MEQGNTKYWQSDEGIKTRQKTYEHRQEIVDSRAQRQSLALRMLKEGAKNYDIQEAVRGQFKWGISNGWLAKQRKKLSKPYLVQNNTKPRKPKSLKEALKHIVDLMKDEGVSTIMIDESGTVDISRTSSERFTL